MEATMGRELIEDCDGAANYTKLPIDRGGDLANMSAEEFFRDLREAGRRATEQFFAKIHVPAADAYLCGR
jgi:hypothetical protein